MHCCPAPAVTAIACAPVPPVMVRALPVVLVALITTVSTVSLARLVNEACPTVDKHTMLLVEFTNRAQAVAVPPVQKIALLLVVAAFTRSAAAVSAAGEV